MSTRLNKHKMYTKGSYIFLNHVHSYMEMPCYYRSMHVKNPLILFMAENNSENVDVDPHSNTRTSGTVTCLPVAVVECLKLKR